MITLDAPAVEFAVQAPESAIALATVADIFQALNQCSIRYCHWKSNLRLEHGLRADTDLDLLVDPAHAPQFKHILGDYNVKYVRPAPGRDYPAIENYLGFDSASGKVFHLHVHYQLVLGEQFVKNYRLPLEDHFLNSVQLRHGVKIPTPELELIVLSLRALLKYRDRDVIKDVLSIRSPGLPDPILNEIEWLLAQTSLEHVAQTLTAVADKVPADVILEFLRTIRRTRRAGYQLYRLRQRVRHALRINQRDDRGRAILKYFREAWRRRTSFLRFSPIRGMTLPDRGRTFALIGADGSGKSTMGQLLAKWLNWRLDVHLYYLGSKQPSRRSDLLYIFFRMARRSHRSLSRRLGEKHIVVRSLAQLRQTLRYSHCLSIGHDRYRRYRAGRQQAEAGSVVIYDRYPLETISSQTEFRLLDGPQVTLVADGDHGIIMRAFARAEQNLYHKMQLPDHLLVLDVHPEISLRRKPDHQRATIEAKSRAVGQLIALAEQQADRLNAIRIDANLLADDVLNQLKAKIWELL